MKRLERWFEERPVAALRCMVLLLIVGGALEVMKAIVLASR